MRRIVLLLVAVLLAACSPTPAPTGAPTAAVSSPEPTAAAATTATQPPSPIATPTAAPTATVPSPEPTATAAATTTENLSPIATPAAGGPRVVGKADAGLAARAAAAIAAIRDHDLAALAGLAHPQKGITFAPYAYVRAPLKDSAEADLVFSKDQISGLWEDPTVYHWGSYDGSGLPIDLAFREYYRAFVYDVEFAQPEVIGYGETIGQGNSINNIAEVWPAAVTVEYHFSGFDPQYAGMDWRSLRLVFEQFDGTWRLVGIVHDQWTI